MFFNLVRRALETERINKSVGLIPTVVISSALAIELTLGMRGQYVFNPPYLILVLGLILVSGVGFVVAYLSAKSYLATVPVFFFFSAWHFWFKA